MLMTTYEVCISCENLHIEGDHMKISEEFENKYVTIEDEGKVGKVLAVRMNNNLKDSENNQIKRLEVTMDLDGQEKVRTLNFTEMRELQEKFGDETDHWVGKSVKITSNRVGAKKYPFVTAA